MKRLIAFACCIAFTLLAPIGAILGTLFMPFVLRPQPATPRSIFETRRAGLA